jgi:uncharacterized membrane protein
LKTKFFGIIGSALIALSILPSLSVFFMGLGLILVGIAVYQFSKDNPKIFNYYLTGSTLTIISSILFYYKIFAIIFSFFISIFSQNPVVPITATIIIYFLIYYLLSILSAVFLYKSFDLLSKTFNNNLFKYGGYFLVIGAVLNIFLIGMILYTLGWVIILLGFFVITEIYDTEVIEPELIEKKD